MTEFLHIDPEENPFSKRYDEKRKELKGSSRSWPHRIVLGTVLLGLLGVWVGGNEIIRKARQKSELEELFVNSLYGLGYEFYQENFRYSPKQLEDLITTEYSDGSLDLNARVKSAELTDGNLGFDLPIGRLCYINQNGDYIHAEKGDGVTCKDREQILIKGFNIVEKLPEDYFVQAYEKKANLFFSVFRTEDGRYVASEKPGLGYFLFDETGKLIAGPARMMLNEDDSITLGIMVDSYKRGPTGAGVPSVVVGIKNPGVDLEMIKRVKNGTNEGYNYKGNYKNKLSTDIVVSILHGGLKLEDGGVYATINPKYLEGR